MRIPLPSVRSDFEGYDKLTMLASKLDQLALEDIEIDMKSTVWFDANMCAPLGAILYRASRGLNAISIADVSPDVEKILSKNTFLSTYGRMQVPDVYGTTIPYRRLEPKDDRYFGAYIAKHLVGKGIPTMSDGLRKKFRESIFEIFSNAVIHSQTRQGIYVCGQYFPRKHKLDFSIADLGIGMRENINKLGKLDLSAEKAIQWAVTGANTTKAGMVPGGLGLKLLREFITINKGRIQIVSDRGFWEQNPGGESTRPMRMPFPGTVVNLELNTADPNSYCLVSELTPDNVF